jgi:hypothetical protein
MGNKMIVQFLVDTGASSGWGDVLVWGDCPAAVEGSDQL